jgi:hypothetical protein
MSRLNQAKTSKVERLLDHDRPEFDSLYPRQERSRPLEVSLDLVVPKTVVTGGTESLGLGTR